MKSPGLPKVVVLFGSDCAEGNLYKPICIFSLLYILIEHNIPFSSFRTFKIFQQLGSHHVLLMIYADHILSIEPRTCVVYDLYEYDSLLECF